MSPSDRLIALHSLNLRERAEETRRSAMLIEAVAFALILAIVALTYGVLS
jgi:hypothetical protein